jgi:hypothetical protein
LVLSLIHADEVVHSELINKADDRSINDVAQLQYAGGNIINVLIELSRQHKAYYSQTKIDIFLNRLPLKTIDDLMSMQGVGGISPFNHLIYAKAEDSLICALISRVSEEKLCELAKDRSKGLGSR